MIDDNFRKNKCSSKQQSDRRVVKARATITTTDTILAALALPMEWTNSMFHHPQQNNNGDKSDDDDDGDDKKKKEGDDNDECNNNKKDDNSATATATTAAELKPMPYCDNYFFDPYDGSRSSEFLFPVTTGNFQDWLKHRKWKWRSRWNIATSNRQNNIEYLLEEENDGMDQKKGIWTNPMFRRQPCTTESTKSNDGEQQQQQQNDNNSSKSPNEDDNNKEDIEFLPYDDNYHYDDDHHSEVESTQYLVSITTSTWFTWLEDRKRNWRTKWNPYEYEADKDFEEQQNHHHQNAMAERLESCTVKYEFWTDRYSSFDDWLVDSKNKWRKSYSFNRRKRKRIQQVCEEVVQFPSSWQGDPVVAQQEFQSWLRVRKNQWRMLRRKRQRQFLEEEAAAAAANKTTTNDINNSGAFVTTTILVASRSGATCGGGGGVFQPSEKHPNAAVSGDYRHIDALLEEEERRKKTLAEQKKCRQPFDLSFLFLPSLGMSDDIAAHIVEFLDCSEHGKLLCISKSFGEGLQSRAYMWQLLCNRCPHWHLPRRPRKPWYKLYLSKLRTEVFASRKKWDDLLTNVADVLFKGDQLKLVKKLIEKAIKTFSFTVDYVSGVVCERNSILNLAVIHQRHKVVKWLLEEKNANIETSDRKSCRAFCVCNLILVCFLSCLVFYNFYECYVILNPGGHFTPVSLYFCFFLVVVVVVVGGGG